MTHPSRVYQLHDGWHWSIIVQGRQGAEIRSHREWPAKSQHEAAKALRTFAKGLGLEVSAPVAGKRK